MTTAAAPEPLSGGVPFADASPAILRAALAPEDAAVFDLEWRAAMAAAIETLDLTGVHAVLDAWRPVAWLTSIRGVDGYRRILARAEQTLRAGQHPPATVSLEATRLAIAEQLASSRRGGPGTRAARRDHRHHLGRVSECRWAGRGPWLRTVGDGRDEV